MTESKLPGRTEMADIIHYQTHRGDTYGVEYVLDHKASISDITEFGADEVVLATGAIQRIPAGLETDKHVVSARDFAVNSDGYKGHLAVLVDEDFGAATYGVADLLAENFSKVIIITSRSRLAGNVNHCSAIGVFRRLYSAGIDIRPAHEVTGFSAGNLSLKNPFSQEVSQIKGVNLVIYSTPRISTGLPGLENLEIQVHMIGDCRSPRNLFSAIQGGYALGEEL
jgi:pyruvate/2-oxoglutarate dehydrogenase complex dihydrolipoamide dehydrogenase (E3) component